MCYKPDKSKPKKDLTVYPLFVQFKRLNPQEISVKLSIEAIGMLNDISRNLPGLTNKLGHLSNINTGTLICLCLTSTLGH